MKNNQQLDLWDSEVIPNMHETNEIDQFDLLEEKVNTLVQSISDLKNENDDLTEKLLAQEYKFEELANEVETLRSNKEKAKNRVMSLLEKIEQINA